MTRKAIVPFWQRLPAIATYPLRGDAAITLVGFTLGLSVLGLLPGLFGLLATGFLWIGVAKYAFEILIASANGREQSPVVSIGVSTGTVWRYILLQMLVVAVPVFIGLAIAPSLGIAAFVLAVLVMPAAIIGLALTESLRRALTPALWFDVMRAVGWPYLALFGLLLVMQISAVNAAGLLATVLPRFLAEAVSALFSIWSLFATFHLMGYLVFQYHEELGFEPQRPGSLAQLRGNADQPLLDSVTERLEAGDAAAARALLEADMRSRAVSIEVHELYRRLLQQSSDRAALVEHGRRFLHQLMMEKQERRALGLARECLDIDANFVALDPEDSARLAERAGFGGQSRLAADLLMALLRSQPQAPQAPQWAMQAADLLSRQAGREAEARMLLTTARAGCEDVELRTRIDAQLAALS